MKLIPEPTCQTGCRNKHAKSSVNCGNFARFLFVSHLIILLSQAAELQRISSAVFTAIASGHAP